MSEVVTQVGVVLAVRAELTPGATAFRFVRAGADPVELTYRALHERAGRVAAMLAEAGVGRGDRVLLAAPAGLDYVAAFFGCLYAGVVAVPAYPPRGSRHDQRLAAVAADARPALALGTEESRERAARSGALPLPWRTVTRADGYAPLPPVAAGPDEVAFLQYTSGSTGAPKGVVVPHRALSANLRMIRDNFALRDDDVAASWLPPYHDMGLVGGLLTPVSAGIPCVLLASTAFAQDPVFWLETVTRHGVTVTGGPDFGYRLCAERVTDARLSGLDLSRWRLAFTGAEPVRAQTVDRFTRRFAAAGFDPAAMHPCYGLAEATLIVSGATAGTGPRRCHVDRDALAAGVVVPTGDGQALVSSGRPLCPVRVVDEQGADRAAGQVGHLLVGGDGVAAGYWGASSVDFDGGWLRTGDLGFLDGGELFVTGRAKELVIVRGRNVYPADVEEQALAAHPALAGSAAGAFAVADGGGESLGVAVETDRHLAPELLREVLDAVRAAVAESTGVTPAVLVAVRRGGLPRTSSGKLQRAELRRGYEQGTLPRLDPAAPAPVATLAGLVAELAALLPPSIGPVGADTALTAVGLDSLGAADLTAAARRTGWELDLELLLGGATLAEVAAVAVPVTPPRLGARPPAERPFWLHEQLVPGTPAYTMAVAARCADGVDPDRLDAALREVLRRHPVLRGRVVPGGEPGTVAVETDPVPDRVLRVLDAVPVGFLDAHLTALCWPPPQLTQGHLVRATLLPVTGGEPVLLLVAHHAVADQRSARVLLAEIDACYAGRELAPPPEPGPVPVPDDEDRRWWHEQLAGVAERAELPADQPAPAVATHRGRTLHRRLATDVARLAEATASTRFAVLLAATAVLVARHTGEPEAVLGVPVDTRDAGAREAVGCLVTLVPVRVDLRRAVSTADAIAAARTALAAVLARPMLPVDELAALAGRGVPGRHPLFDVVVADESATPDGLVPVDRGGAAFDLSLLFAPGEVTVEYALDRFAPGTAERLADRLETLLAAMAADPARPWYAQPLDPAAPPHLHTPAPAAPSGAGLLHEMVWAQVDRTPDALAVHDRDTRWSYRELRERAEAVAGGLRSRGIGPGDVVALRLPRSAALIAAMLGVLETGAAYLPLDPGYPPERLAAILADAAPAAVLGDLEDAEPITGTGPSPQDAAYVVYTSGSTGRPKGVVVEHRHIAASTAARHAWYGPPPRRFLLLSSPAFDSSVAGIYWTLTGGGTLHLAEPGLERDSAAAWRVLAEIGATHTLTLPTLWAAMLEAGRDLPLPELDTVVVAGEECRADVVARHHAALPDCRLVNEYGPTEAAVWATVQELRPGGSGVVPIGSPVPGMTCRVLDRWGAPVPAGIAGELHLSGPQVARGYLRRPEETAVSFYDDPCFGRTYRTGDRVSVTGDGVLRFHGRVDAQVKIRGQRVEPGEVEAVLAGHPAVADCAVTAYGTGVGVRLAAYVVLRHDPGPDLLGWLGERLPPAYLPQAVLAVPALPRTPNGKVDRRALPDPAPATRGGRGPDGPAERAVAEAFAAVLACGPVGADDDFFALGGHSLAAAQLSARLGASLGVAVRLGDVFEAPTVAQLAARLGPRQATAAAVPIQRQPRTAATGAGRSGDR
ncbi:non-ribosomal peptide synthetase [Catellatospora tritici]|uniref:non-ribosomal peptide synthetase n=1 Tax=Catellatospora tritici TaxID=2851566 RepID=UPI001C2CE15E|nr:non-ribosomal peptide synthetase [Catellatospora tritici]MBV1850753.1 amino acid adenylation domain-containing protein [Catellatospora tritici]MBV1851006.1 amino acid adenylation domain-containing protein [Catellatospora tritici]